MHRDGGYCNRSVAKKQREIKLGQKKTTQDKHWSFLSWFYFVLFLILATSQYELARVEKLLKGVDR